MTDVGPGGGSVQESVEGNQSALHAALVGGLRDISRSQTITFTEYVRVVLPLDGFVFWVRADQLGPSARPGVSPLNTWAGALPPRDLEAAATRGVLGSFHFSTQATQEESASYAVNRVIFTSEEEVPFLNEIEPGTIWVGAFPADGAGNLMKFAFEAHGRFYQQAGLWHYTGDAVYATMLSQLIDDATQLNTREVVVSNSLPFWLSLGTAGVPVFPSFLVPDNQTPPYVAAHIPPEDTAALQPIPWIDANGSHWQLAEDRVSLTLYGLPNAGALDFVDRILDQIGYEGDPVGLMGGPIVQDEKRGQVELGVLAQAKRVDLRVSYYQSRLRKLARQLILTAFPSYVVEGQTEPLGAPP